MNDLNYMARLLVGETHRFTLGKERTVRSRTWTKCDYIAFRKRVTKRRAKKGYK